MSRLPPHVYFVASAVFHYLGPAGAVLLFAAVEPLGVAWLRIAGAGLIFALWRRPWRHLLVAPLPERRVIIGLGLVLAAMNAVFYLAIDRLPLATVGAIEFLGPIGLAAWGLRRRRNLVAFGLAAAGVALLVRVELVANPLGYVFALGNCALFVLYIVLGHRIAGDGGRAGIDRLGAAMLVATVAALPIGFTAALPAFADIGLLAAAIAVGVSSSVIPYVCDQLAMARLPRSSFALMLALLPATAVAIGAIVLGQIPSRTEMGGIALVIAGVALHRPARP